MTLGSGCFIALARPDGWIQAAVRAATRRTLSGLDGIVRDSMGSTNEA